MKELLISKSKEDKVVRPGAYIIRDQEAADRLHEEFAKEDRQYKKGIDAVKEYFGG